MPATQIDGATPTKVRLRKLDAVHRSNGNKIPISTAEVSPERVS